MLLECSPLHLPNLPAPKQVFLHFVTVCRGPSTVRPSILLLKPPENTSFLSLCKVTDVDLPITGMKREADTPSKPKSMALSRDVLGKETTRKPKNLRCLVQVTQDMNTDGSVSTMGVRIGVSRRNLPVSNKLIQSTIANLHKSTTFVWNSGHYGVPDNVTVHLLARTAHQGQ